MNHAVTKQIRPNNKKQSYMGMLPLMLFFPVSMFFCEIVARLATVGNLKFGQFLLLFLTSVTGGFLFSFVLTIIINNTALKIVMIAASFIVSLLCSSQVVYHDIFGVYYNWEDIGMAGEAAQSFSDMLLSGILNKIFILILLFLPTILIAVFNKRLTFYPTKKVPYMISLMLLSFVSIFFMIFSFGVCLDKSYGGTLHSYLYPNSADTYMNFGILTASKLNIEQMIFGKREGGIFDEDIGTIDVGIFAPSTTDGTTNDHTGTGDPDGTTDVPDPPKEYGYNVLDIDFDTLIANEKNSNVKKLHEYFKNVTPTKKNEYTGMFEGKNLIFMTLEGFSSNVISPELTPTLYKMANEGFVFKNFYNSVWSGSTLTGEYANLSGNMYMTTGCLMGDHATNYQPFALGTQFSDLGYKTMYFHGHTHSYYGRNKWVPSFGYQQYYGYGNGLEKLTDASGNTMKKRWPNSDEEVAKVSIGQYIGDTPFHVYYMSISGHAEYNFLGGNAMCSRHKSKVQGLPYKYVASKAYIACQLEVEAMLNELISQLEMAGILDDTVFVLAPDHFPYGIRDNAGDGYSKEEALSDLYGIPVEDIYNNIELYRNSLIIWSSSMEEPVIVDTPCSAIDILPTVSNLFGIEYDSRLMTGVDVMSDVEPLVILKAYNAGNPRIWINKYGSYVPSRGFVPAEGYTVDKDALDAYVSNMNKLLSQKYSYSKSITDYNYYSYLKDYLK